MLDRPRIPILIITGFVGSGKTTLILKLLGELQRENPDYRMALIKNEIGDVNVDSQLAASAYMQGEVELFGACICCTNVGQVGDALATLDRERSPDRIIIETSGSAEPIKLLVEVNRLARETGRYEPDGVVSVIDVQNWEGYAHTSFTAKLQARQTDLIVLNKWEEAGERREDEVRDQLGAMDVDTPYVRSDHGWVRKDLLFGIDTKLAKDWITNGEIHRHNHSSEMECLSVTLAASHRTQGVDLRKLEAFLQKAPKDEIYRIKAVMYTSSTPNNSDGSNAKASDQSGQQLSKYILNWAFGRWTWTQDSSAKPDDPTLRMFVVTAAYESTKWQKRLEGEYVCLEDERPGVELTVRRMK
ncbi:hypothetical protein LTR04_003243 [Oleoguttula sp. CCFEE 6159]|nr:hypothetical protein LTR04_003243 [Oleoguttula sp. CCFEE 6159]